MAREISERDIQAAIQHIKEADNYAIITDRGVVLLNRNITAIKIAQLERIMKDCVDKYIGHKSRES